MKHTKLFINAFILSCATAIISMPAALASYIREPIGLVELKPKGKNNFEPIGMGERVGSGDRLRLGRGAEVELVCSNGNSVRLYYSGKTESVQEHCPGSPPIIRTGFNNNISGGNNPHLPYVISPRMTYLLTEKPTLRWNEVEGVTSYTVRVETEDRELLWQTTVSSTAVDYPGNAPSLEWGEKYLVVVEASNGASSRSDLGANLGFEILEEYSIQRIQEAERSITQNSTGDDRAISLADLYQREYLITNAIKTLKEKADQGSPNALIYMRLGDLYRLSGLNLLAEVSYEMAIQLLSAAQQQYSLAETQARLANVKLLLGKEDEAERLLEQAIAGYRAIAANEKANAIEERLPVQPIEPNPPEGILTPIDVR
ncbi:MAG: tetratricopeptide repeat protein [Coleofasciculus sp. A1-SPW-01]|uniref:tetratricopeptide repeat protein n=1 Tax=Coleofasciculus sp. A1-SPW-01 TaxID=3070819 RepID=UPI0032F8722C